MLTGVDRVVLEVPDLAAAQTEYAKLLVTLGAQTRPLPDAWGFVLRNTVIDLREAPGDVARIAGLVLCDDQASQAPQTLLEVGSTWVQHCDGQITDALRDSPKFNAPELAVDHVVLRTNSADRCIANYGDQLGIRLALDQTVEKWGGRMLFFRTGKMTLEVIDAMQDRPQEDYFWGIAYQCPDLDQADTQLITVVRYTAVCTIGA